MSREHFVKDDDDDTPHSGRTILIILGVVLALILAFLIFWYFYSQHTAMNINAKMEVHNHQEPYL